MQQAVANVNGAQSRASELSAAYERGETVDIAKVMLARQEASVGRSPILHFCAIHAAPNTPICLPKNSPIATATAKGANTCAIVMPANDTPALVKANKGKIKKAL